MSDFDKFFAEKLGEEGHFPQREKNWRALSKRLDAFDTGLQQQIGHVRRYLRYWQAAAACAIVTAGLLTWKLSAVQKDNAGLRREVTVLQEKNNTAAQEIALLQQRSPNETATRSAATGTAPTEPIPAPQRSAQGNKKAMRGVASFLPGKVYGDNTTTNRARDMETTADADASAGNQTVAPPDMPENTMDPVVARNQSPAKEDDRFLPAIESRPETISTLFPDSLHRTLPRPPLPNVSVAAALPKIIEPVRNPSRFRAGIQVLAGVPLPREKGISILLGQGIAAEYNVWRSFWLTASADWMRYDISTEKYIPKFHSPHQHPPSHGGSPNEKLVKVESTQRQQQFGLGLRYSFPLRSWVRPALRAAYTVTRISPELITYKFEHHSPGGPPGPPAPKYKVQKSDSEILENVWRFGAGLEHETPAWVFGIWADYSKNFAASDLTFDALTVRAGIQYRFN